MDQQLRLGRIVLADAQANHQQVTIDMVFQGNDVKPGIEYFGIWRDLNEGSLCPFVMNENGECVYQFDILNVPIEPGAQIGWRSDQYETQMKVASITQMV
jgi:hypothetical protein